MIIKNAEVYTEEGKFEKRDIFIKDDKFVATAEEAFSDTANSQTIDGTGCYAIPGLIDIHFHGCVGHDFCDGTKEAIDAMARYEASVGVGVIVPATMTLAEDTLTQVCRAAKAYRECPLPSDQAELWGINMEGPFIAESKKGAQNPEFLRKPDVEMFERLNDASGGAVRLVDIAPETEGAMEFIRKEKDVTVLSLAHTATDYDTAMEAFGNGASHVTHLYNAMNPYTHRAPGLVSAAADAGAEVELICDGVHIHPSAVRTTFKIFGDDKIILISDSMMATGLEDGEYSLGGQPVKVRGNLATLHDGTIAGSATNLLDCMRTAVLEMNIPIESAVKCATVNPAKSVGLFDRYGSMTPGKVANVVLLKKDGLKTDRILLRGKEISC